MELVAPVSTIKAGIPAGELPKRGRPPKYQRLARYGIAYEAAGYSSVVSIPRAAISRYSGSLKAVGIATLLLIEDSELYACENRRRWERPTPEDLADILDIPADGVSRALLIAGRRGLVGLGGGVAGWSHTVSVPRGATRIDARRLGYPGLALLAALTYRMGIDTLPDNPYHLNYALDLNLSCIQVCRALSTLVELGYIDSGWRPVVEK